MNIEELLEVVEDSDMCGEAKAEISELIFDLRLAGAIL